MMRHETNLADFLPRRLAWGIVIVVLLAVAIYLLINLNFGGVAQRKPVLDNRDSYMQLLGLKKAEIQAKFGPPDRVDSEKNELFYDLPHSESNSGKISSWISIGFNKDDYCTSFFVED